MVCYLNTWFPWSFSAQVTLLQWIHSQFRSTFCRDHQVHHRSDQDLGGRFLLKDDEVKIGGNRSRYWWVVLDIWMFQLLGLVDEWSDFTSLTPHGVASKPGIHVTWFGIADSNRVRFPGSLEPSRRQVAAMQFKAKLTKMEALSMVGSPADFKFEKSAFLLPPGSSENLPYQVVLLDFVHQQ